MVFILIPTHNRSTLLGRCLDSITKQSYSTLTTVIVDDGSTDNTNEIITEYKTKTPIVRIYGDGNLWWTGAMRKGIEYILTKAKKRDFVLLMNDDTVFEPGYIDTIVNVSKKNHRSIITSLCFDDNNRSHNLEAGVKISWTAARYDIPLILPKKYISNELQEVDAACGRGTLVPIEVFQEIGNFSNWLPHYHSDYEFMIRAKKAGFRLLISYSCKVYATSRAGGLRPAPQKTWNQLYNKFFSIRSKTNIIDQLVFIFLATPIIYKPIRFYYWLKDIIYSVFTYL